ncbi:MAG: hypothetical protein P4L91_02095 [Burkholderiaceae bacterium]|nr:hypothetical protein [Burkholderiaceae bacterium]
MAPAKANYEVLLLSIPAVATLLDWFWIGNMNLFQSPGNALMLVALATVLGSAFVVSAEARALGMVTDKAKSTNGPTAWFFSLVLLWIVAYPLYLYRRKAYGVPNRMLVGLVLALVFTGSQFVMASSIEAKKAEVRNVFSGNATPEASQEAAEPQDNSVDKLVDDEMAKYDVARRNGSKVAMCVHAGAVAALLSQLKDEESYQGWKHNQRVDCKAAGLPFE